VIAYDGAAYRSTFGVGADVELAATDPATPDAVALPSRGRGAIDFDPAVDEIAVFDEERTLLDVVNYNGGVYPMIRAYPSLAANTVISRSATGLDIDDNALDFFNAGSVCGAPTDCPDSQCNACADRVCVERPDGLSCSIDRCPIGRCFVGVCTARPDAGACTSDASTDGASDAGPLGDGAQDGSDATLFDAGASDASSADAEPTADVIGDVIGDVREDTAADRAMDASLPKDTRSMDVGDADGAGSLDGSVSDDRARAPSAGCSCRAATTARITAWHLVAVALGRAVFSQRKQRWRRN